MPAPKLGYTVLAPTETRWIVATQIFDLTSATEEELIHAVNLTLEVFGHCQVFDEHGDIIGTEARQLAWEPLPADTYSWDHIKGLLTARLRDYGDSDQTEILKRLEYIFGFKPNFTAFGPTGFSKCVVFGFDPIGIYVLESLEVDNATYILRGDWEMQARMTKSELTAKNGANSRLIHSLGWRDKIRFLLDGRDPAASSDKSWQLANAKRDNGLVES